MSLFAVEKACRADLPKILNIYAIARNFMKNNGNGTQWGDCYPDEGIVCDDISKGQLYAIKDEGGIIRGAFSFIIGNDPTYENIKGKWHSDAKYGTIHRIASDGTQKGIFNTAVSFCKCRSEYLRIDTHQNNKVMQHLITKCGFHKCGTIYTHDGTPRIAYDRSSE